MQHNIWRMLGTRREHIEEARVGLLMLAVTGLYEVVSAHIVGSAFSFNWYEFIGTWSGLVCVWLCRTRNIMCWPWGIVSAVALGALFGQIHLPGQQWLNWGYFLIIQIVSWPYWAFGGEDRTEPPVTVLTARGHIITLAVIVLGTFGIYKAIGFFVPGSLYPIVDALVVASSVVAQFLMGWKKVESWILWLGPVNMASIFLFAAAGAYTVMALYVAYFVHAFFAIRNWHRAHQKDREALVYA